MAKKPPAPTCPYCGETAVLTDGRPVYRTARFGHVWTCGDYPNCDAYVTCHPNTTQPLGRLANAELRKWKKRAHAVFDPMWKAEQRRQNRKHQTLSARKRGYTWLASALKIDSADCHIGMFDVTTCQRVVELCKPYAERLQASGGK